LKKAVVSRAITVTGGYFKKGWHGAHLTKGMSQTHNSQHIAVIGGH